MEAWVLKMEQWRVCRPLIVDSHHFDKEQDSDPHQSKKRNPYTHKSDASPRIWPEHPKILSVKWPAEVKFLNGFNRDFWAQTQFFSDLSFCLVFYPHFSVLQNAFRE